MFLVALFFLLIWLLVAFWPKIADAWYNRNDKIIYDFTKLNPTRVSKVITPQHIEQISEAVKNHNGKICIGGGRFSMGGQIAYPDALHIDMRQMNRLLHFDRTRGIVKVEAGMNWKTLQGFIAPEGWAVKVMQSYNAFSIGGSVNVNCHGRYMGEGPLSGTILSLKVVLANGATTICSRNNNRHLFNAIIGSMGGLAVIVEVELQLAKNCHVKRVVTDVPTDKYLDYVKNVSKLPGVIFHNGNIGQSDYKNIRVVEWVATDEPLTEAGEIQKEKYLYLIERFMIRLVTTLPIGTKLKEKYIEPLFFRGHVVTTRNHEASYDPRQLMPTSWLFSTYVLQEYFVPAETFIQFMDELQIITDHFRPNILNISTRHAERDTDSLLSWARHGDNFCFVIYYKQGTSRKAQEYVGQWTKELVSAVLRANGTYYPPYQLHPTPEQYLDAHPKAIEFAQMKQKLDSTNKFTNKFWDKYLPLKVNSNQQQGGQK